MFTKRAIFILPVVLGAACAKPSAQSDAGSAAKFGAVYPRNPIVPSSWTQTAWYIDPVSGSDNNTCTTSGSPCKTFAEVAARWGTYSPLWTAATTITYLSSASDNSDPLIIRGLCSGAGSITVKGQLGAGQQIKTGTLASVTAKARTNGASSLLQADLGAGVAVNQLIVNTTHSAAAWIYANVSGTVYSLTQPCARLTGGFGLCSEVDTWANTDAFTVYQPTKINIAELGCQALDTDNAGTGGYADLIDATVYDPEGAGAGTVVFGWNTFVQEASIERTAAMNITSTYVSIDPVYANVAYESGAYIGLPYQAAVLNVIEGGYVGQANFAGTYLDSDVILKTGGSLRDSSIGKVYVPSAQTLNVFGTNNANAFLGQGIVWGPGTLNIAGASRISYASGASKAAATFTISTLNLNGQTKSCLDVPGAATSFGTCNITISAANLDTNLGTTIGCLGVGNGGAFCNEGL